MEERDGRTVRSSPVLLRRLGGALLLVGLLAAVLVFLMVPGEDAGVSGDNMVSPESVKRYNYDLERLGGKSLVWVAEFNDWLGSLWHGRKLAGTLIVLFGGAAWICFWISTLPPEER